jgi:glycopeptide antibiotics resistance protein
MFCVSREGSVKKAIRIFIYSTLPLYVLLLVYILFLYSREHYGAVFSFAEYIRYFTNVIPFKSISLYVKALSDGIIETSIVNLFGNLLFFLPMGLYLPCLFKTLRMFSHYTLCMICLLFAVEAAQLLLKTGSFDIDDIILNVTGACFGFFIFRKPVRKLFNTVGSNKKAEPVAAG